MLFYKITGIMEISLLLDDDRRAKRELHRKIEVKSEEFNRGQIDNSFYFISEIDNSVVTAGIITENKNDLSSELKTFYKHLYLPHQAQ